MKKALLLLWAAALLPSIAHAQWEWTRDGRREFSDHPPPSDIPERNILRRPSAAAPRAPSVDAPNASAKPAKPQARDEELEARKKAAADAETAKQRQQEQQTARIRAENCAQARDAQRTLDSGMRIAQLNAQGERVILDDSARAIEGQRIQAAIAQQCR